MKKTREELIQWLLNQGAGIVYSVENAETTEKEKEEKPFSCVRYVESTYADCFEEMPFPDQVDYAIEHNMDLIDFDEWQAIQHHLFGNEKEMSPECAGKINHALWAYHDETPLDLDHQNEYEFLLCYIQQSSDCWCDNSMSQLRAMWTTYCLHHHMDADTAEYDRKVQEIWNALRAIKDCPYSDDEFEHFDNYMCRYLV